MIALQKPMSSVENVKGATMSIPELNDIQKFLEVEDLYERYTKVNQFLNSLMIRKIINDYRIMSLEPDIVVKVQPPLIRPKGVQ